MQILKTFVMLSNKESRPDKREQYRMKIRRKELDQKQRKRMADNIIKLQIYIEEQSLQSDSLLPQLFDLLPQPLRPTQPYSFQQFTFFFPHFTPYILAPSTDQTSLKIIITLQKLLLSKPEIPPLAVIQYLITFIQSHTYESLANFPLFRKNFLYLLEYACLLTSDQERDVEFGEEVQKLKVGLLKWCRGSHSLRILTQCFSYCLSPLEYSHIYAIIEHNLDSQSEEECEAGITALLSLVDRMDQDDSREVSEAFPGIFPKLLARCHEFSHPSHQLFLEAIIKFLNTYDSILVGMARMGLVELLTHVFEEDRQSYVSGLVILNHLVYVRKESMGNLLKSKQMTETWNKVSSLHCSKNRQEQTLVYSIFSGFFNSFDQPTILHLLQVIDDRNSIFALLNRSLTQDTEDNEILLRGIEIIRTLLYYLREKGLGFIILEEIVKRGFLPKIERAYFNAPSAIAKLAGQIIEVVDFSKTTMEESDGR